MNTIILKGHEEKIIPVIWTGKETELSYDIHLERDGAKVIFLALLLGQENQSLHLKTNVYHHAKETTSEIIVKSALTDLSSVNFEWLVTIEKDAKGTKAWLAAHILLLSNKARGRAIPSLEILENDIKAGHATTVGRINALEIFYLMSRGLPEKMAKKLIISGFLQGMIERFPKEEKDNALKILEKYNN